MATDKEIVEFAKQKMWEKASCGDLDGIEKSFQSAQRSLSRNPKTGKVSSEFVLQLAESYEDNMDMAKGIIARVFPKNNKL